jgi:hypothetical protein
MKKALIFTLLIALIAGAMSAPAVAKKKKPRPRVVEGSYDQPALGIGGVASSSAQGGAIEVSLMPKEKYFSVEVIDDSGTDVYASLSQDTDPTTPSWEIFAGICGKTDAPIEVTPGIPVRITVTMGPGSEDLQCAGLASAGTIKATVSSKP